MSISTNFPAIKPSLSLDFANTGTLDPRVTFARASTATYYDGVTTAKAEENLLLQSQDFTTSWSTPAAGATVTSNTGSAPDGTTTADTATATATTGDHYVNQTLTMVASQRYVLSVYAKAGTINYIQLVLGTQTGTFANFDITSGSGVVGTSGGVVSTEITNAGNGWYRCVMIFDNTNASSVNFALANSASMGRLADWTAAGTETVYLWGAQLEQRSAVSSYTPTTTQPIVNYIPVLQTAASGVARFDHNPTTSEALGLLIEEQRTNLLTYSSDFSNAAWSKVNVAVTADTIVAPDGTLTGDFIGETVTVGGTHRVRNATVLSVSGNTSYTCTVYAKAGFGAVRYLGIGLSDSTSISSGARRSYVFDLSTGAITTTGGATWTLVSGSATLVGNGWYRCQITVTTDASASNMYASIGLADSFSVTSFTAGYDGDGYSGIFIWGAQLEAEAVPSSYIATISTQVTRLSDLVSMTGTNFSSWFNAGQGTMFSEFQWTTTTPRHNSILVRFDDGTNNNHISIGFRNVSPTAPGATSTRYAGGTTIETTTGNVSTNDGQVHKSAGTYTLSQIKFSGDGLVPGTATPSGLPVVTIARIGSANTGVATGYAIWIRKVSYYPQALTAANLQALTS